MYIVENKEGNEEIILERVDGGIITFINKGSIWKYKRTPDYLVKKRKCKKN